MRAFEPPEEYLMIEQWLEENTEEYRIKRIHAAGQAKTQESKVMKVEYYYRRPPGRGVDTVLFFTFGDDGIERVDSEL